MDRWGALVDDQAAADGLGLVLIGEGAKLTMLRGLLELRSMFAVSSAAIGHGTLSFRLDRNLGAVVWKIQGPPKDRVQELYLARESGEILMAGKDFQDFKELVEARKQGSQVRIVGLAANV